MLNANTAPYGALVLRVSLGIMFIAHALLKYFVFTLPGTVGFFEKVGFPDRWPMRYSRPRLSAACCLFSESAHAGWRRR